MIVASCVLVAGMALPFIVFHCLSLSFIVFHCLHMNKGWLCELFHARIASPAQLGSLSSPSKLLSDAFGAKSGCFESCLGHGITYAMNILRPHHPMAHIQYLRSRTSRTFAPLVGPRCCRWRGPARWASQVGHRICTAVPKPNLSGCCRWIWKSNRGWPG